MSAAVPDAGQVAEFLFVASQNPGSLQAFQIDGKGALSPVTGSPFAIGDTPRKIISSGDSLIVAGTAAIIVFQVDKVSGALRQTDSVVAASADVVLDPATEVLRSTANGETTSYRLVKGLLKIVGIKIVGIKTVGSSTAVQNKALMISPPGNPLAGLLGQNAVTDATGKFAYALNPKTNQIDAFSFGSDRNLTPLNPPAYPAGNGAVSIALVAP
jgi:hypothetical protein